MPESATTPRIVLAGLESGAGKTTVALGLVGALRRRGLTVQTFKVGPDLVDCAYLSHASGRPCRNLDAWMLGEAGASRSFVRGVADADCAVIEGTMGIFDGHGAVPAGRDTARFPGSTAELAMLTGAPVALVIDVGGSAETAAAMALGVRRLDPRLDIIGVILNNVPNEHRHRAVEDAIWRWATLPVLGALPRLPMAPIPEVRTGLLPLTQNDNVDAALEVVATAMARHCDLELIERLMARVRPIPAPASPAEKPAAVELAGEPARPPAAPLRIGVAFDDAFCFYYAENLELLEAAGATIVPFSPLDDSVLPPNLAAIYLGGGVSQVFVPRLAANRSFIESFRRARNMALPLYAECGGVHYCTRTLRTSDGRVHEMTGVLPVDMTLEAGQCHSGYREVRLVADGILGPADTVLRGHEFHFSRMGSQTGSMRPAYVVHDADGEPLGCEGWTAPNLLASLIHLHFAQDPRPARHLVDAARTVARQRRLDTAGV